MMAKLLLKLATKIVKKYATKENATDLYLRILTQREKEKHEEDIDTIARGGQSA